MSPERPEAANTILMSWREPSAPEEIGRFADEAVRAGLAERAIVDRVVDGPGENVPVTGRRPLRALLHLRHRDAAEVWPTWLERFADRELYLVAHRPVIDRSVPDAGIDDGGPWIRIGSQTRREDVDPQAFRAAWGGRHAELVARHHPGVDRYAQHVVLARSEAAPPVDGFYEARFPTAVDFRTRLYDSPEGERTIEDDNRSFVDQALTERVFVRRIEHGRAGAPSPA
ncbi:MAG: hypothetical protein BGO95_06065 [Micrococcales bacterium 73-13]|nr:MAG: hypothetical protein BGO95_06065 [Micrococcales bacterium 73-13]